MWHTKTIDEIFTELNSSKEGLSEKALEENKGKYGNNELELTKKTKISKMIFENIKEPLTLILIAVIAIMFAISEYKEAIVILLIITINIVIATAQEVKSQKALDSLKKMTAPTSTVIRNNKAIEISSKDLVVGDIVLLETGNYIPADIRSIELSSLKVNESALTGESLPVEKNINVIEDEKAPLGDCFNMLYSSTFITNGRGTGIVVATGNDTEIGKIANLINNTQKQDTPLQNRLAQLSKYISVFAFAIAGIILALNYFMNNVPFVEGVISAITLAVAIIPESLPVIVSIILALSVSKMAKYNAIVKKLPAVESLGTVNVICSDKTGTLTINKMNITDSFIASNALNDSPLLLDTKIMQAMILCNDSFIDDNNMPIGDPTELALTYYAHNFQINELEYRAKHPRINEIPFDSDRKLMSTVHKIENHNITYTKGAIDQILELSTHIEDENGRREITKADIEQILKNAESLSEKALRVIAFAYSVPTDPNNITETNMTFLGAVGMIDPERPEAKLAIEKAKDAGVKTIMITGDHPLTAFTIAKRLGIAEKKSQVITGKELNEIDDKTLSKNINNYRVFSRVNPEHKVRIVEALQKQNNIVAMTGDGVNDAPSLQAAHIGVSMGITGTDVAKDASDMVLMDDDFSTIVYAVEEGRNIYNKIKRAIMFVLATNFGEVMAIFMAVLLKMAAPLGAIHVLWVNLIVESLIAIPISMDTNDSTVMLEKPRPKKETIFANMLLDIGLIALFMCLSLLGSYAITLGLDYDYLTATSVAFLVMSTAPMLYVLTIRTTNKLLIFSKPWQNPTLVGAIVMGLLLNTLLIYSPLNAFFNLTPLTGIPLLIAFVGILIPTILYEIYKAIKIALKKS